MEVQPLRLTPRWADVGLLVVEAEGVFNATTAPLLCGPLVRLLRVGHRRFVVDAERVTHFNTVGIQLLAATRQKIRAEGGTLALVAGSDARSAFETADLGRPTFLYTTVVEAARACETSHQD
ncbi:MULTISPECIES: STAS domain-containing protein [Streptomyces]|uniref:STAS domain-containing protein n=1 Tax=Streptomyces TaxID=1883 RepID=UPI00224CE0AF|nr:MULTISPECIES: STAS domain-containing protein [Streptomyces]MCX4561507.1 STAS domain-containing protein [Streptomyces phaeochromogenes]MCX4910510.1 STAS domain-containing protein [Streptomyces sp. NBC_00878]WSJ08631.1 STAS domain-containing protein [Streptomyces phaeochromogenes]WSW18146.1 STAS domain-containing protein [Streptomyces phaeochromogenes]